MKTIERSDILDSSWPETSRELLGALDLEEETLSRVLLIEDDPSTRLLLATLLEEVGHTVEQAADGSKIPLSEANATDLIVTDLFMPGREGLETIRHLRVQHPSIPILAISVGYVQGHAVDFLKAATAVGADEVLRKPFAPSEFLDLVARLLSRSRLEPQERLPGL